MEQTRISSPVPHGAHEARAARGAAPGKGADGPAAAQGDGFALLLAMLGGAEDPLDGGLPDALAGTAADASPQDPLQSPLQSPLQLSSQAPPQVPAQAPDAAVPGVPTAGPPPDALPAASLAERLAALAQAVNDPVGEGAQSLAARLGLDPARPRQDTLVGQTALLDGAPEAAALNGMPQGAGPAGRGAHQRGLAWAPQEAGGLGGRTALRAAAAGMAEPAQSHKGALAAQDPASLAASAANAAIAERRDALHAALAPLAQPGDDAAAAPALLASAGMAQGPGAVGSEARAAVRGGDPVATDQPQRPEAADAVAPTAEAAQTGAGDAQEQLAERVAYWVHQKTQNAELTLDRDGRPVEVTVALTGDEAHVTFRSDHAEARQWLDTSAAQLREMLQREGLQLAGVTVGTAGGGAPQRDGGERERARQGARGAAVQAMAPAGAAGSGRGVSERSVDIFV